MLLKLAHFIDHFNRRIGKSLAWLVLGMVLLTAWNVLMRYAFSSGVQWQTELVMFFHSILFLGVMGYALQTGDQVRVDVFYANFPPKRKAWVDLLGSIFLLLPLCGALIAFSWHYVGASWELREASPEYQGMQGLFLLKTMLVIGPALLGLQGISMAIHAWQCICANEEQH